MIKKKILAGLLVFSMVGSMLAGCGKGSADETKTTSDNVSRESAGGEDSGTEDTSAEDQGGGEASNPEINIFTLYSETNSDSGAVYFLEALEMAREKFPNYTINHETADVETYKTKIKTMIAANETPDIFYSWGGGFVQPFVEAGQVLALDEYLDDDTKSKMKAGAFDGYKFDDKLYGLSSYLWIGVLYCNEELFAEYNLEYPTTYDELLSVCKTFRVNGVTPMAVGMKDKWTGAQVTNAFIEQLAGAETASKMTGGTELINNDAVIGAANLTLGLVEAGAFPEGTLGLTRDEAEADFMQGKTAMELMGTWLSAMLDGTAVDGKVTVVKFPLAEDAVDENEYFGGDNGALCVGANCEYPEETVEVCQYLAEQCAILDGGLVSWEVPEEATENVNSLNKEVLKITTDATGYVGAWDTILPAAATQDWLDLVAELYGNNITAEDFAKRLDEAVNK